MNPTGAPDLAALKAWLGLEADDTADDVVLSDSLNAALVQQCLVVCYPCDLFGEGYVTDDLKEALFLRAQKLAARRNSPTGLVGLEVGAGDFVGARVPAYDVDVAALEGPYRRIVSA